MNLITCRLLHGHHRVLLQVKQADTPSRLGVGQQDPESPCIAPTKPTDVGPLISDGQILCTVRGFCNVSE